VLEWGTSKQESPGWFAHDLGGRDLGNLEGEKWVHIQ